ncbi:MAG: hypothetical protein WCF54_06920 [Terracidiphilus sp.]
MEVARQRQAVVKKPRGVGFQQNKVSRGKARMNAAADKILEQNSDEIAKSLLKQALDGNTTSVKLLFALADGQFDCENEGVMQNLLSLAEKLASEPEFNNSTEVK